MYDWMIVTAPCPIHSHLSVHNVWEASLEIPGPAILTVHPGRSALALCAEWGRFPKRWPGSFTAHLLNKEVPSMSGLQAHTTRPLSYPVARYIASHDGRYVHSSVKAHLSLICISEYRMELNNLLQRNPALGKLTKGDPTGRRHQGFTAVAYSALPKHSCQ